MAGRYAGQGTGQSREISENCELVEGKMCGKIKRAVTLVMLQSSTLARESTTRMHVPPQPLMRSLLSQSLTPTPPRRVRRFFRVRVSCESLHRTESPSLLRTGYCLLKPTLSAIDASNPKREGEKVNAEDWCKRRYFLQAPTCAIPAKIAVKSS